VPVQGCTSPLFTTDYYCSRTPLIRINWDGEPSGYAENPGNWIFLSEWAALAVLSCAVAMYCVYLRANLSTTLDLEVVETTTLYCT